MSCILNDVLLKNLTCSVCEKYLSVLPIKVYPNRLIKCGRCCVDEDGGTLSFYNTVISSCLFKCINRYEGCKKLLPTQETEEHEKQCVSKSYHCPKCDYKFSGSALQLLSHYYKQHPNSVLKNNIFFIKKTKKDFREQYLFLVNDNIFFVLVENLSKKNVLYLSAVSLVCKNVCHSFSIRSNNKSVKTPTKPCVLLENFNCDYFVIETDSMYNISCKLSLDFSKETSYCNQVLLVSKDVVNDVEEPLELSTGCHDPVLSHSDDIAQLQQINNVPAAIEVQTMPLENIFGVKLTDDFKKQYPNYKLTPCGTALYNGNTRIELTCSNCKELTGCNGFNCHSNKHILCWDCKAWCGICDTSTSGWDVKIATINELLLLPCKWQCGQYFSGTHITEHQQKCEKSKVKCPQCQSSMNLQQICVHLVSAHRNYKNMINLNLTGYLKESTRGFIGEVYFSQNGYWFKMYWRRRSPQISRILFDVLVESIDKTDAYELAIICDKGNSYKVCDKDRVSISLDENPRFYLKRLRNL